MHVTEADLGRYYYNLPLQKYVAHVERNQVKAHFGQPAFLVSVLSMLRTHVP